MLIGAIIAVTFLVVGFILGAFIATLAHREIQRENSVRDAKSARAKLEKALLYVDPLDGLFNIEKREN